MPCLFMKTLAIVKYPQRILQKKAEKVSHITPDIQKLIPQMIQTMNENDGIGLAAPQINISQKIIVVQDIQSRTQKGAQESFAFLNPHITQKSTEQETEEEGCLSLPGIFVPVKRARKIEVVCQTPMGETVKIKAEGLFARIFQHEIDHLNGKLIIHKLTPWKRLKIRKQLTTLKVKK